MNYELRSRRNRFTPGKQRMVDPDAWTTDDESSPQPAAEELPTFPVPAPSSSSANTNADHALPPLITQPADPVAAAIARRQNMVVTVTSTQFRGTDNPNSSSQQDGGVPIVTIAVSAGVGVFLAASMVGCWWWFCKRPYTRRSKSSARPSHKNQTSTSSVAPLKGSSTAAKAPGQRRSREKQPGLDRSAPPSHTRSASGGPPGGQQQKQRRPGQPAVPPPAITTTTPPNPKRRSPPGASTPTSPSGRSSLSDSTTLNNTSSTNSPSSTVSGAEEPSTPRKGGRGSGGQKTGYAPQKPSPLAAGAERAKPKEKPKEKAKVNEWGMGFPVSNASNSAPSSPTRSSSSGHGHQSMEPTPRPPVPPIPSVSVTSSGGRQSANLLAMPEPAVHYHSRRDRISVLSDSSYYALDDEEYGPQDVYMGVALGGDEPSPIPEEYFSPNWDDDEEEDDGKSKMARHQDDYISNRLSDHQVDGYYYQQQSYEQPSSQSRSQGGYGYGGYQQSYRR